MPLPSSGSISLSQINTELGRSSSANISLDSAENGSYVAINQLSTVKPSSSNPASMSEWRGYNHSCTAVSISPSSVTINQGQSTTLTASGASSYSWNTGATTASITVSPSSTTTYTVTGTTSGCTATGATRTVTVIPSTTTTTSTTSTTTTTTPPPQSTEVFLYVAPEQDPQNLCNNQPYDPAQSFIVYVNVNQDQMQFPYRLFEDIDMTVPYRGQDLWWWNFNINQPILIDGGGQATDFFQC